MASDEEENVDDIDEELARIEEQLQELDEQAGPEPPAPEPEDADAPAPEEAFEGEPDIEEDDSHLSRLLDRLRSDEGDVEEAETDDDDDADGGVLGFLSDDEDEEDVDADEEADPDTALDEDTDAEGDPEDATEVAEEDTDEADEGALDEDEPPAADPSPAEEEASDDADPAEDTADDEPLEEDDDAGEETGFLGGLTARFRSEDEEPVEDEPDEDEAEADEADEGGRLGLLGSGDEDTEAESGDDEDPPLAFLGGSDDEDAPDETEPGDGHGADADEPDAEPALATADDPGEDEDEADEQPARASALLARFQGGGSGDPDDPPAEDDEDDDGGGLLVAGLVAVLLLAGLAVGAYMLLPGSSAEEDLSAELMADSFTDDGGSYVATTGQPITLDARGSQGSIDRYVWSFGDGTEETTTEPTVEHTYQERGSYTVEVTVENGDSDAVATIEVTVVDPPTAEARALVDGEPVAEPGTVGNNPFVGDTITLDANASSADPDRSLSSYEWDLDGDGEADANGPETDASLDEAGRWALNLTVRDDLGNEDTATLLVHVSDNRTIEDTIGPSSTEAETNAYPLAVDQGRSGAEPIRLGLELTYNASSDDGGSLPVQPTVDPDLDLNVSDPEGNVHEAEDDEGEGTETLTLEGEDLANLGEWNVTVTQDNQNSGTASEAQYELVIQRIY